jgi:hypothetical protein
LCCVASTLKRTFAKSSLIPGLSANFGRAWNTASLRTCILLCCWRTARNELPPVSWTRPIFFLRSARRPIFGSHRISGDFQARRCQASRMVFRSSPKLAEPSNQASPWDCESDENLAKLLGERFAISLFRSYPSWDGIPQISHFCGTQFLRIGKSSQRKTKAFH